MTCFLKILRQTILLYIIHVILRTCDAVAPDSPCPEILTYNQTNMEKDRWYATVNLTSTESLSGVWLDIELDRKAHLLGNYFGEGETSDNQRFIIKDLKKKFARGSTTVIKFFVKYNKDETVPIITTIRWNGKEICPSVTETPKPIAPTIVLPSGEPQTINLDVNTRIDDGNNISSVKQEAAVLSINRFQDKVRSPPTAPPSLEVATTTTMNNIPQPIWRINDTSSLDYFNPDDYITLDEMSAVTPSRNDRLGCGNVAEKPLALTVGGQITSRHLWPWHASLYHYRNGKSQYICGATLISPTAVVTAAHCVTKRGSSQPIDPLTLNVFLAKQNIILFMGGEQVASVSEIIVHSNYTSNTLYADIAILKLSSEVTINDFVRPVCIWEKNRNALETVLGRDGTVVGWEFSRNKKTNNQLNVVEMPVVDTETCIRSSPLYFKKLVNDITYCAGYKNGSGICNGDSGSGMFFNEAGSQERPTWKLRGVVSIGAAQKNDYVCDVDNFVLFTDVSKFSSWIEQYL